MTLRSNRPALVRRAINTTYQRAIDAHTVEDAVRYHSELVDLLSTAAMMVRASAKNQAARDAALRDINASATYHRDVVDRLTDIIERNQQLVWQP